MSSAANLSGIFIVLDVTVLACSCTDYKYERDKTFGDRLDSDQFKGGKEPSQFVCLLSVMV